MAQLALAGAGAVLGSLIPGVGTALGWSVGAVLGGMLFPPKQPAQSGPRLSDLEVSASTYGISIPRVAGTVRIGGNMIWTAGIREETATSGGGGKGGFGAGKGPRITTYTYFATFAVGFCAGPTSRVLRMWADTKLIYDETGTTENVQVPGLIFRFYPGDETQLPDPAIIEKEGEENAPAYRGLAYVVIEDAPLQAFGNRIPSLVAEIATGAGVTSVARLGTNMGPSGGSGFSYIGGFAVDWTRGRAYRGASTLAAGGDPVVSAFDTATLAETARTEVAIDGGNWPEVLAVVDGGALYARPYNGLSCPVYKLDGDTLAITATFGTVGSVLDPTGTDITAGYAMATAIAYGLEGPVTFVVGDTFRGALWVLEGDAMSFVWGDGGAGDLAYQGTGTGATQQILAEPPTAETVGVWIVHSRATTPADVYIYRLDIGWDTSVEFAESAHLTAAALGIPAGCVCEGAAYDATDGGLIMHLRDAGASTRRLVKWTQADGILWSVSADMGLASAVWAQGRIQGQSYGWMATNDVRVHDTRTGALLHSAELAGAITGIEGGAFDSVSRSIVATAADGLPLRAFLERGGGLPEPLSDVVTSICVQAGLDAGDIDVTELVDDDVRGYRWEQGAPREHLQPLASAFSFDAVETGGQIAFRKRGRAPVATITYAGVARVNNQERNMAPRRAAELELPRRLTVRYRDVDRDQLQGAAHWVRPRFPARLTDARAEATLDLDLVLSAGEAKAIARRNLAAVYSERTRVDEVPLPPAWLLLDPTDVVNLQTRDGGTLRVRLDRVDAGADFSLRIAGPIEGPATYNLAALDADGGQGFPPQYVAVAAATRLAFPDLPLLRDMDDSAGVALRIYLAAAGYSDAWTSASAFWSRDSGASFETLATLTSAMAWGTTTTLLAEPASPWTWDDANTLTVAMQSGAARIESSTDLQVLNGANAAALVKSDGSVEIIQWRDVTVNGNGTLTLSRLLRGRRGTDDACAGHAAGEMFVLLEVATWRAGSLPLSDLNVSRLYRVAGTLDTFDAQPLIPRAVVGRAEQPYSPVHIEGTRDGSDNLSLTWVRRTRIGGEWLDGTGTVPLAEDAEEYEVDVLDAPGGAVVRTITGLSSPAASYSAADQTTDFGSPQSSVTVLVFQISAAVGRGVPREATI